MAAERQPGLRGRSSERTRLDQVLDEVRGGHSAVLVIRGEAGVGKTALLRYVTEQASGFRVAQVAGVESEMELAYAGLHQLLFHLTLGGRFRAAAHPVVGASCPRGVLADVRLLARLAIACLIAGVGLLNVADAAAAHAVGVGCLIAFVTTGFYAIAVPALDGQALPSTRRR